MRTILVALAVALFTASGATAAFVVTSANIKNGTIQPVDLSAKTKRVMRGARGPRGPQGDPGPVGDRGPQGPPGFAQVFQVISPQIPIAAQEEGLAIASCPAGQKLTGGGFFASHPTVAPYIAQPSGQDWRVRAFNFSDQPQSLYAYAICVANS